MQTYYYFAYVAFGHGVQYPGSYADIVALYGDEGRIDSRRGFFSHRQSIAADSARGIGMVGTADIQGIYRTVGSALPPLMNHHGKLDKRGGSDRIGHGYQCARRMLLEIFGNIVGARTQLAQFETTRRPFDTDRRHRAGSQNHYHGSIENFLAKQVHAKADSHHSERHCRMGIGKLIENRPLERRHSEGLLSGEGREPFRRHGGDRHYGCHVKRAPATGQNAEVDHHSYANQKIRDKQRIAHKFYPDHQRRTQRHISVKDKARDKGSENALDTQTDSYGSRQKDHDKYIDKLGDSVAITLEEPARQARIDENGHQAENSDITRHPEKRQRAERAFVGHFADYCQNDQRADHSENSSGHGNDNSVISRQPETRDYRICQKSVGRKHRRQQKRRFDSEAQKTESHAKTDNERNDKSIGAEKQAAAKIAPQMIHIYLKAGQKHQVKYSYLTENLEAHVAPYDVESVGPDSDTGQNQADDVWQLNALKQQRNNQNDCQHNQKDSYRIGNHRRLGLKQRGGNHPLTSAVGTRLPAVGKHILGNLHGIEGRSLFYLIADSPETQAAGICEIFAHASYINLVFAGDVERHGIAVGFATVDNDNAFGFRPRFYSPFNTDRLLGLDPGGLAVGPQNGNTHTGGADSYIRRMHDLARLVEHLHLFLGISVVGEDVDMGNDIESELMDKFLDFHLPAGGYIGVLPDKLIHGGGSGSAGSLISSHSDTAYLRDVVDGLKSHNHLDCRAVRIGDYIPGRRESVVAVDFGNNERNIVVHAESTRIINHQSAARCDNAGIFARRARTGRGEHYINIGKLRRAVAGKLADCYFLIVKYIFAAGAPFRSEKAQPVDRKTALGKHLHKLLAYCAAGANNCYIHILGIWVWKIHRQK